MKVKLPSPVLMVLERLEKAGFEAYLVGGAVRDLLLGKEVILDWDFTTNATPDEILPVFSESFYGNNFGTVMVAPKHVVEMDEEYEELDVFDITTFRSEESYSDRRRPDKVEWGKSLQEDVKRRDFTINAMALKITNYPAKGPRQRAGRRAGKSQVTNNNQISNIKYLNVDAEIIDHFGGQKDLENKLITVVGDADERFREDALRMMRAIRFGAQLSFEIESETLGAIKKNAGLVKEISWERIRDELMKTLASDHPADGILLLYKSGLLEHVLPELLEALNVPQGGHHIYDVWKHMIESLRECPSSDVIVRLATLLHDVGKPRTMRKQGPRGVTFYGHEVVGSRMVAKIADRFKLSKKEKEKLVMLVRWHMFSYDPEMTDAAIRRFIRRVGKENINDMMMLRIGDRKGGGSKATSWRLRELQQRIGENLYQPLSISDLKIGGKEVMKELKMKPGPEVGRVLEALFEEVMEGKLGNDGEELIGRARELAREN